VAQRISRCLKSRNCEFDSSPREVFITV